MSDAPNGYKLQQAVATWMSVRSSLLSEDPDLASDEAALTELLGEAEAPIEEALERIIRAAQHAEAMAEMAKLEMERLAKRKARYEHRSAELRRTAFAIIDVLGGKRRREYAFATASIRAGGKSVVVTDEAKIPANYWETIYKLRKANIMADLKQGIVVPGAELGNGLESLMIKST